MIDPANYSAFDKLKDGTEVRVRAIRPDDSTSILEAFSQLDAESIYRRFFTAKKELSNAELKQFTDVDFHRVTALVVTTRGDGVKILLGGGRIVTEGAETSATRRACLPHRSGSPRARHCKSLASTSHASWPRGRPVTVGS